jgi:hypothetical protein
VEVLQNAGSFPYDTIAVKIALALGVGLVVGLEREWAQKEVGVRTFAITALLGMLTSLLALQLVVTALAGVFLLVAFLNIHSLLKDQSLEMTTSAALIVTLVLGAFIGQGHDFTAVTSAILVTMLLAWKVELARFADALLPEEIHGAVSLGLLSFVIYPRRARQQYGGRGGTVRIAPLSGGEIHRPCCGGDPSHKCRDVFAKCRHSRPLRLERSAHGIPTSRHDGAVIYFVRVVAKKHRGDAGASTALVFPGIA